jgi:A/G-specific adenine glycosylase
MPVRKEGIGPSDSLAHVPAIFSPSRIRKIRKKLISWGEKNFRAFPWRAPTERWHGLLAEVLLQRTRAHSVVLVYEEFVSKFRTPSELAQAPVKKIERMLYPLGLRWRAAWIKRLAKDLTESELHQPASVEQLQRLPGVGPYAAAAYLSFHCGKRAAIVDANVVRWICRMIGYPYDGETRRKKWLIQIANKLTPRKDWKKFNYALLDFTMQVCTASPKCEICPIGPNDCVFGRLVQIKRGANETPKRLQRSSNKRTRSRGSSRARI